MIPEVSKSCHESATNIVNYIVFYFYRNVTGENQCLSIKIVNALELI